MKSQALKIMASLLALLAAPLPASAETQPASLTPDSIHIQRCSACHYVDGKSPGPEFPNIAGQYESYLIRALKLFKENKRDSDAMELIASLHKQQELVILANYYAKQPASGPSIATPDMTLAARGEQIYTSERVFGISCADCHGADAKGYMRGTPRTRITRSIPRLAGQQPVYLKTVLRKYTSADPQHPGMCGMRKAGKNLNHKDIDALVEYISSK
jgi:cytochrome c553